MKSWILSVGAMILLTAIITIILPKGKTSGLIKSVFALLSLLVIIQPVTALKNGDSDFSIPSISGGNEIIIQENYLEFIARKRNENNEKNCEKILTENGINGATVSIEYTTDENASYEIQKVTLNFENSVINSDKEHIYIIETAIEKIAEYLDTDSEVIEVYGK